MQSEVTLTFTDEAGRPRAVKVGARYFAIGRSPENDLSIPIGNLSRQHALIERFENFLQITDCGSQNGTQVNGETISGAVELRHGDVITLGGVCDLEVSMFAAQVIHRAVGGAIGEEGGAARLSAPVSSSAAAGNNFSPAPQIAASRRANLFDWQAKLPLLAVAVGAASLLALLIAGIIFLTTPTRRRQQREDRSAGQSLAAPAESAAANDSESNVAGGSDGIPAVTDGVNGGGAVADATPGGNTAPTPSAGTGGGADAALGQIEEAAMQVMRRVSTDPKDYSFSEKAVGDIARKIDSYKASPTFVRDALMTLRSGGAEVAAAARNEGIAQPYFVFYAALAECDGGRSCAAAPGRGGDALGTARAMLPDLIALRTTLGDDQDSSLLVIAAYPEGAGTKKSHPLLGRLRRVVRNPVAQRNVWYAHENGAVDARAYDLVIRFLALGVIAQNPRQFGVNAEPLAF